MLLYAFEWKQSSTTLTKPTLVLQILVKTMIRKRSFGNPFEGSRREERSLSAPGNLLPKQGSEDNLKCNDLPNVGEEEVLS